MFNRSSFDRSPFDRSATFDTIEALLRGDASLKVGVVVQIFLEPFRLSGSANMQTSAIAYRILKPELNGIGDLSVSDSMRLRMRMNTAFSGEGSFTPNIAVRVPIPISFSGQGDFKDSATRVRQIMNTSLSGNGHMEIEMALKQSLNMGFSGSSDMKMNNSFKLLLSVLTAMTGFGEFSLRRIGALNSDSLELENINLEPGQTVIIDTDEFNVFIDNVLDVDSVTSDSIFFNLQPGENEITIKTSDSDPNLDVTIIFQNRWL